MHETLTKGYKAIITCIEEATADPDWLGQTITGALVEEFVQRGIDPCGELGEYHTFVVDGPLFQRLLAVHLGAERHEQGFRQLDVTLADDGSSSGMAGAHR